MDKVKVVFLSRTYSSVLRGVETHVKELSKRLKFDVEVLEGKEADDLSRILKGKFDVVIPTNGRMQAVKVGLGKLIGGYKTIITGHAGIGRDDYINLLTLPNVFVALTDFQFAWAKKFSLMSKIVKIPNGIDLSIFTTKGKKKDLHLQRPIILSVGALEWYKNHDLTIKAVSKLKKGSVLIIGSGSKKEELLKLGSDLLGYGKFRLIAEEYKNMPEYYRGADLFMLPSWDREAFGIVYLEAMASGLPVIAPKDSIREEIIQEGGVLVENLEPVAYAKSIEQALSKKWDNLPRNQASKYSWDIVAEKYTQLIQNLCQ